MLVMQSKVTNTDENLSTEKALVEVTCVWCFPFPERTGEVIWFENDVMASDGLTDTTVVLSVSKNVGTPRRGCNSPGGVPIMGRRAEQPTANIVGDPSQGFRWGDIVSNGP
jgi:hypothetical protein